MSAPGRLMQQVLLVAVSPPVAWRLWSMADPAGTERWLQETLTEWHVVGSWSLGVGLVVVVPLLLQAGTAIVLDGLQGRVLAGSVSRGKKVA